MHLRGNFSVCLQYPTSTANISTTAFQRGTLDWVSIWQWEHRSASDAIIQSKSI
jgi:hypothetical protein